MTGGVANPHGGGALLTSGAVVVFTAYEPGVYEASTRGVALVVSDVRGAL